MKRTLYTVLVLLSVFTLPWWCGAVLLVAGIVLFKNYFEGLVVVFLYESVFTPQTHSGFFTGTLICLAVLAFVEFIRPYLRK